MITAEPIAVYDSESGGGPWPDIADWCTHQGLNPNVIYRLEIYPYGKARVFEYEQTERGKIRRLSEGPARREPYVIAITGYPPDVDDDPAPPTISGEAP